MLTTERPGSVATLSRPPKHTDAIDHRHYTDCGEGVSSPTDPVGRLMGNRIVTLAPDAHLLRDAESVGAERTRRMDAFRKPQANLGESENLAADRRGVLGELIFARWLRQKGVASEFTLLSDRPVSTPDFKIGATTYEVKTANGWNGRVTINCETHQRRRPHYYIAVVIAQGVWAILPPVPAQAVDGWPIECARTPYFVCAVQSLLRQVRLEGKGVAR